jgi:hypothetical protein
VAFGTCPECGEHNADPTHVYRCNYRRALLVDFIAWAAERDIREVAARDLAAHLLSGAPTDFERALKQARTVIDLGWRPVVGTAT